MNKRYFTSGNGHAMMVRAWKGNLRWITGLPMRGILQAMQGYNGVCLAKRAPNVDYRNVWEGVEELVAVDLPLY